MNSWNFITLWALNSGTQTKKFIEPQFLTLACKICWGISKNFLIVFLFCFLPKRKNLKYSWNVIQHPVKPIGFFLKIDFSRKRNCLALANICQKTAPDQINKVYYAALHNANVKVRVKFEVNQLGIQDDKNTNKSKKKFFN